MRLRKLQGNWCLVNEYGHEDNLWIAFSFSFGAMMLEPVSEEIVERLGQKLLEHAANKMEDNRVCIDAVEKIYSLFQETSEINDNITDLNRLLNEISFEIAPVESHICNIKVGDSERLFYCFGERLGFDIVDEDNIVRVCIKNSEPNYRNSRFAEALGIISDFCADRLFEIYRNDRTKTHLAKYQDRYFAANLGL